LKVSNTLHFPPGLPIKPFFLLSSCPPRRQFNPFVGAPPSSYPRARRTFLGRIYSLFFDLPYLSSFTTKSTFLRGSGPRPIPVREHPFQVSDLVFSIFSHPSALSGSFLAGCVPKVNEINSCRGRGLANCFCHFPRPHTSIRSFSVLSGLP